MKTYTAKIDITLNGIKWNWYITKNKHHQYDEHYILFPNKNHTKKDIDIAKDYIKSNYNPTSIRVIK